MFYNALGGPRARLYTEILTSRSRYRIILALLHIWTSGRGLLKKTQDIPWLESCSSDTNLKHEAQFRFGGHSQQSLTTKPWCYPLNYTQVFPFQTQGRQYWLLESNSVLSFLSRTLYRSDVSHWDERMTSLNETSHRFSRRSRHKPTWIASARHPHSRVLQRNPQLWRNGYKTECTL